MNLPPTPPRRTVLLRHTLPDRTWHVDWLVERSPGEERPATWRLPAPLDAPGLSELEARRLLDHRRHYLTFEGDIGGGRGEVVRIAEGVVSGDIGDDACTLIVNFGAGDLRLQGRRATGDLWRFRIGP